MKIAIGFLLGGLGLTSVAHAATTPAYEAPEGWTRSEDPKSGLVTFAPPGLPPGSVCSLLVFPVIESALKPDEFHQGVLRDSASAGQLLDAQPAGTVGAFEVSELAVRMQNGAALTIRLYTARWADRGQAFALTASSATLGQRFQPAVDAMIGKIALVGALKPAANTPPPSTPAPRLSGKGGLSGLYVALKAGLGFSYGVVKEYMVFFPDGTAFWHLPAEGLLGFDVERSRRQSADMWGRYEMRGSDIAIHWNGGQEYAGKRQANGQLLLNTYYYIPVSSGPDGRTLDGTYRPDYQKTEASYDITFHPDGSFEDRGVRAVVASLDMTVPTGGGKGRYRIAQDSIVLEYSDGRRAQLSFYTPDGNESRTPPVIVINTYSVSRLR